jgi:hypothetical protein
MHPQIKYQPPDRLLSAPLSYRLTICFLSYMIHPFVRRAGCASLPERLEVRKNGKENKCLEEKKA